MSRDDFIVPHNKKIRLRDYQTDSTGDFSDKKEAAEKLQEDVARLAELQDVLYAQNKYALLLIFQAMDAAGKDSAIKHVMSGVNPQGCQVYSFKEPSAEELEHDFLWRCQKALPERGRIGIFNRSYYEEVLIVRVHPEFLEAQRLPDKTRNNKIWGQRFDEINDFERHLAQSGIVVLKFFLNVSKEEQKQRFLARIETPEKNWKFSLGDVRERGHWDEYMHAYEEMLKHTSTKYAPWHVIPADKKWFARAAVARVIVARLKSLDLRYPTLGEEHLRELAEAKEMLEKEDEKP